MMAAIREVDPTIDFRVIQLRKWASKHSYKLPLNPHEQIHARANPHVANEPWAMALHQELAGADIVWVEWCQRAAVLVSLLDLAPRRIVIRLHSFEAFTVFPHLVDPSSVDALVTVSPTFRKLIGVLTPDLDDRTTFVPNAIDLRGIGREKTSTAPRTLGLVGWAAPAKDAVWALDVLDLLRRDDDQWTLHLVGAPPDPNRSAGEAAYAHRVTARLEERGAAVTQSGQVTDVAAELAKIGVILSSSTRESFHVALAEGIASGARPVVRDWPMLSKFGGAATTWPAEWIVQTPDEAAALITTTAAPAESTAYLPDRLDAASAMIAVLRGTIVQ
jgi:glycosyltransferase involved in cell wall biosynthesis